MAYDEVARVLLELYRPWQGLASLARCFAEVAVRVTDSPWARVELENSWGEGPLMVTAPEDGGAQRMPPRRDTREERSCPVGYQDLELGRLVLPGSAPVSEAQAVARTLGHHLMRMRVAQVAGRKLGRDVALVGASRALAEVDRLLEGASRSSLPVLLVGPVGSEVERLGVALHLLGLHAAGPFVQVHCGTLEGKTTEKRWRDLLRQAVGGTLLLAHLESLEPKAQSRLLQHLETGDATGGSEALRLGGGARVVASVADDVDRQVELGALDARLLAVLEVLRIDLPSLRRRRADVPPLVEYFLRRNRGPGVAEAITPEAMTACVGYDWPGDRMELAHTMARLAVLAGPSGRVELRHLRELVRGGTYGGLGARPAERDPAEPGEGPGERLLAESRDLHPSLRRAVQLIVGHEGGELRLSQVAAEAHVSESHLSHLLRREMGTTFTRLVASLRVERAKELLRLDPWMPISTVAARAGFTHVRQMERTFKRAEGCTPSGFRRRIRRSGELRGTWRIVQDR